MGREAQGQDCQGVRRRQITPALISRGFLTMIGEKNWGSGVASPGAAGPQGAGGLEAIRAFPGLAADQGGRGL